MVSQWTSRFPHKTNEDGSVESICIACHVTVASGQNEAELAPRESRHVCDPISLYCANQAKHVPARSHFESCLARR
jgi:hypothetical protein